jgi:hypothetical protein
MGVGVWGAELWMTSYQWYHTCFARWGVVDKRDHARAGSVMDEANQTSRVLWAN